MLKNLSWNSILTMFFFSFQATCKSRLVTSTCNGLLWLGRGFISSPSWKTKNGQLDSNKSTCLHIFKKMDSFFFHIFFLVFPSQSYTPFSTRMTVCPSRPYQSRPSDLPSNEEANCQALLDGDLFTLPVTKGLWWSLNKALYLGDGWHFGGGIPLDSRMILLMATRNRRENQ